MTKKEAVRLVAYHLLNELIAGNFLEDEAYVEEVRALKKILGKDAIDNALKRQG